MLLRFLKNPNFTAVNFHIATTLRRQSTQPLTKEALQSLIFAQCHQGKFKTLLQNAVASTSVLLTACHNLSTTQTFPSHFVSLQDLSFQLSNTSFEVESCCSKGNSLVLPNLKLKVVLEALRIVLEAIYDDKFVTFSYGGRASIGRHTAVRYLRNTVENPVWWFSVKFDSCEFDAEHVERLCCVLGEKIDDGAFIDLIRRLFECGVVKIELGGVGLGRGFAQECGLGSILVNVYLNGFDKEVQEMRSDADRENPKFKKDELVSGSSDPERMFYKPLKIYAVRYLDEILIITSGTKEFTLDLKNRIVKFLENLSLRVNQVQTVIHSAVFEKIEFMGMELQAVAPSVLRPVKSDKAIRAQKKYQRQKEARLLWLKNAKERNRKMLGMKLLKHVFKKFKQSNGFEFDFQIENEVRQVFGTWGDEVVQDYLKSVDDNRWEWHRNLTAGDFLSLGRIRDLLPRELVEAHDNFQLQVDRYLNPVEAKMVLEKEVRRKEEEEEKKYAKRTVEDLTKRCIRVEAPLELIRKAVRMVGFTNNMGRPRPIGLFMVLEDADIIKWYAGVARRWLDFYCCCHNFRKVKTIVTYHLRYSCILTLAEKHEATKIETIRHFTKDLKVSDSSGVEETYFPSEREIIMMRNKNLSDPKPVDAALTLALTRLATDESCHQCIAHFCESTDTILYRINLLQKHLNVNPSDEENWVHGMGSTHNSLHRKCIPLCLSHASEFYMGRLTLQDIDCTLLVDVG